VIFRRSLNHSLHLRIQRSQDSRQVLDPGLAVRSLSIPSLYVLPQSLFSFIRSWFSSCGPNLNEFASFSFIIVTLQPSHVVSKRMLFLPSFLFLWRPWEKRPIPPSTGSHHVPLLINGFPLKFLLIVGINGSHARPLPLQISFFFSDALFILKAPPFPSTQCRISRTDVFSPCLLYVL